MRFLRCVSTLVVTHRANSQVAAFDSRLRAGFSSKKEEALCLRNNRMSLIRRRNSS
jgi:hypothetical protein